ncbi:MAG TPA: family 10 glycosylhydrolase, partial [Chthoniobacterales bacterium]
TGSQGTAPGYDPLGTFIQEGKRHGIAIHAWINPYRAAADATALLAASHEAYRLRGNVRRVGNALWLDPGSSEVRQHVVKVVADLLRNYDVAGLVLDDYFYPYPAKGHRSFPDAESYARYTANGGSLEREPWRRENVNGLIQDLRATVRSVRPGTLFGVSPFGIYTRGQPSGVTADLDQYHDLYADPVKWLRQGWVDYLSPQLYWKNAGPQSYSTLLRWWRSEEVNPRHVPIYPSIALERLGPGYNWPVAEIQQQLSLEKAIQPRGRGGFILWNVGPLLRNEKNIGPVVAAARG